MPEVLQGQLAVFRLASLLQLVEGEQATGSLGIDGVGSLSCLDGQIVGAACGSLKGLPAAYELFFARDGGFRFATGPVPRSPPIGSMLGLILEGSRLSDEWERLAPLHFAPAPGRTPKTEGALAPLLPKLDGRFSVADLAAGRARVPLVDPLLALCEAGDLVEVAAPGGKVSGRAPSVVPQDARAAAPLTFDEAMDRGRRCLRDGDLEGAETAFHAALARVPDDRIATQNLRRVQAARQGQNGAFSWFRKT